jgi:hypothetical protein
MILSSEMIEITALCRSEMKTSIIEWMVTVQLEVQLQIRPHYLWDWERTVLRQKYIGICNNTSIQTLQPCWEYILLLLWFLPQFHSASLEQTQKYWLIIQFTDTRNSDKLERKCTSETFVPNYYTTWPYFVGYLKMLSVSRLYSIEC